MKPTQQEWKLKKSVYTFDTDFLLYGVELVITPTDSYFEIDNHFFHFKDGNEISYAAALTAVKSYSQSKMK